jgi:hypothetical protein
MKVHDLRTSRGPLNHASREAEDPFDVKAFHLAQRNQGRGCVAVMDVRVSGVDAADGLGNREEVGLEPQNGPGRERGCRRWDDEQVEHVSAYLDARPAREPHVNRAHLRYFFARSVSSCRTVIVQRTGTVAGMKQTLSSHAW